ncbi:TPA: ead/Ea22-like family protein [Escherichia coli]|uniref:ead/Ea22-like family protein n=1 Tax=Escherichia coli TaxID=562 RepID=UPI000BB8F430|nr:ead/Ea22-like family protein [Escherichia coli]HBJ0523607.1 ead/Ea22-like family protein [Escherichia coli]HBJ0945354.1 ead/Ea22-like family protein [Escherichia coli]
MSEINYQALREKAERAIPAMERLLMLPVDDDLLSEQELKDYGVDIDALNAFKFLTGPETVLALLDELEAKDKRVADMEAREVVLPRAHDVHPLGPQSAKIFCEFHRSIVNRCADEIRKVGVKVSIKGN